MAISDSEYFQNTLRRARWARCIRDSRLCPDLNVHISNYKNYKHCNFCKFSDDLFLRLSRKKTIFWSVTQTSEFKKEKCSRKNSKIKIGNENENRLRRRKNLIRKLFSKFKRSKFVFQTCTFAIFIFKLQRGCRIGRIVSGRRHNSKFSN